MEIYENLSSNPGRISAADQLRNVGNKQEQTLEGVNKFKPNANEYGATNTEVIDDLAITDKYVNPLMAVNFYNDNNQYKTPE